MKITCKRGVFFFISIALFFAITFVHCTPEKKFKVLSLFFDGVPNPAEQAAINTETETGSDIEGLTEKTREVERLKNTALMHRPVADERCKSCHINDFSNELITPIPQLCYTCHEDFNNKFKLMHGPAASGYCTACHDPHEGEFPKLLTVNGHALCFKCHNSKDVLANKVHNSIGIKNCTECHNPHGADNRDFLRQGTCYTCHDSFNKKFDFVHGPVVSGNCTGCHGSHDLKSPKFLLRKGQDICLYCHNEALVFSNKAHLKANKINCTQCHNPHGGRDIDILIESIRPVAKPKSITLNTIISTDTVAKKDSTLKTPAPTPTENKKDSTSKVTDTLTSKNKTAIPSKNGLDSISENDEPVYNQNKVEQGEKRTDSIEVKINTDTVNSKDSLVPLGKDSTLNTPALTPRESKKDSTSKVTDTLTSKNKTAIQSKNVLDSISGNPPPANNQNKELPEGRKTDSIEVITNTIIRTDTIAKKDSPSVKDSILITPTPAENKNDTTNKVEDTETTKLKTAIPSVNAKDSISGNQPPVNNQTKVVPGSTTTDSIDVKTQTNELIESPKDNVGTKSQATHTDTIKSVNNNDTIQMNWTKKLDKKSDNTKSKTKGINKK